MVRLKVGLAHPTLYWHSKQKVVIMFMNQERSNNRFSETLNYSHSFLLLKHLTHTPLILQLTSYDTTILILWTHVSLGDPLTAFITTYL